MRMENLPTHLSLIEQRLRNNNGDFSVVACTLLCESGSTGSIPVSHPKRMPR